MSDKVDRYIATVETCECSARRVDVLIDTLEQYAVPLIEGWLDCRALDDKQTAMCLKEIVPGTTAPSLPEIQTALAEYIEAATKTIDAWNALTAQEQELLTPPAWQNNCDGLPWLNLHHIRGTDTSKSPANFPRRRSLA
jgi:hypothetical protein